MLIGQSDLSTGTNLKYGIAICNNILFKGGPTSDMPTNLYHRQLGRDVRRIVLCECVTI